MAKQRISANDPWDGIRIAMLYADEFRCRPEWRISPMKVSHAGVLLFVEGTGWQRANSEQFEGRPGRMVIVQAGDEIEAGHDPDDPVTVLSIGFQLSGPDQADATGMLQMPRSMMLNVDECHQADQLMRDVITRFKSRLVAEKLAARAALLTLLAWVATLPQSLDKSQVVPGHCGQGARDQRIEAVCRYIDEHLADSHTLGDLAQVAHLSAAHFGVVFRSAIGMSPLAYVRRRRIEAAKAMLTNRDETVEFIAREVGFDDPYHFSRVFRRTVGVPPSVYAESIKRPFF